MSLLLPDFTNLQPYLTALAAAFNLATLAFVVNLANLIRNAAKDKIEVLEAQNKAVQKAADDQGKLLETTIAALETQRKGVQADLERTEKWHAREVEELTKEVEGYKNKLSSSLDEAGIDFETLLLGRSTRNITDELKQTFEKSFSEMQSALKEIYSIGGSEVQANPDWYLELGKGFMAKGDWKKAAQALDEYVHHNPLNWEVQFSRALSHANTRGGAESDLSSLRAYNEAIALLPIHSEDVDVNLIARLFSYRGAMLKRLGRLDEAEADLTIAQKFATRDYELQDICYNFACVYALRGEREKLFSAVASIRERGDYYLRAIYSHLGDYFVAYAHDEEFLKAIALTE